MSGAHDPAKAAALRKLAAAGILVSPELAAATPAQLEQLLAQKPGQLITTALPAPAQPLQLTVADVIAAYQRKFERLRDLLLRQIPAVSLKAARAGGSVSCIGMVRELLPAGFLLEDQTATLAVVWHGELPERDDVLAVTGSVREGRLLARELVWPDIPLPKAIPTAPRTLVLGSDVRLVQNPHQETIAGIRVLAWQPLQPLDQKQAIGLLKKRWLLMKPTPGPVEPALLEPVPDIFWLVCEPAWTATYKGVTIVAGPAATIDLRDRSVQLG